MTCQTCGREAENGKATHWIGCEEVALGVEPPEEPDSRAECEHDGCSEPKASASPRAKWCETHKDPKTREK